MGDWIRIVDRDANTLAMASGRTSAAQAQDDAKKRKLPVKRRIIPAAPEVTRKKKQICKKNLSSSRPASKSPSVALSGTTDFHGVSQQNLSVLQILSQNASTRQSQAPGPLPESTFIANCREGLPVPRATTATLGLAGQKRRKPKPTEKK